MSTVPTKEQTSYLEFQTPQYSFQMKITKSIHPHTRYYFIVGDKDKPCLDGTIRLKNTTNNTKFNDVQNTATLHNIKSLMECSLEDITDEYAVKYSFGTELLEALVFFINAQFPDIKSVTLTDDSEIYCNDDMYRLDLLAYSIALYKKTWYELKMNAYMVHQEKYESYRSQVEQYASKEAKQSMSFHKFYQEALLRNSYTLNIINDNLEMYEQMYNQSETFPEVFQKMSKSIPRNDKCKFFREWLKEFISSYITIGRKWQFDLYPKITVIQHSTMKPVKRKTRKQRN